MQLSDWCRRLYRRAIQQVGSRFYTNPDQDVKRSVIVAGTARSGTTWLSDLIASQIPCRILFEPFNPELVPDYASFCYFQYMRPGVQDKDLYAFASQVMTGMIRNPWIDHQNERIFPKYRLIKEIRANLLLKWLHDLFPEAPILFIIRHPCAVVLSRMNLRWATDTDIKSFLMQPNLVSDYLTEHLDLIQKASTEEEKHAIIWSVSNLVPLRQFQSGELKIVYYENLCTQPEVEIPAIYEVLHEKYDQTMIKKSRRPSLTAKATSAVVTGTDKISHWKNVLSNPQIDRILKLVRDFGLDHIYGDGLTPLNPGLPNDVLQQ